MTVLTWALVFLTLKKVYLNLKFRVRLEIRFIFRIVFLDIQSFTENLFLSVLLLILCYPFYGIWSKTRLCYNYAMCYVIYISRLCYMQISYRMVCNAHVRQLTLLSILSVNQFISVPEALFMPTSLPGRNT